MFRRLRAILAIGGLAGLGLVLAPAAVIAGDPCYHGYTIPPTTSAATATVNLEPCAFVPTAARVAPGATVTFTNTSGQPHLITGANNAWGDRDAEIAAGASRTVTFDRAGIYPFSCALHRGMTGVVSRRRAQHLRCRGGRVFLDRGNGPGRAPRDVRPRRPRHRWLGGRVPAAPANAGGPRAACPLGMTVALPTGAPTT